MLIALENVLESAELQAVRQQVEKANYVPGATTAGEGSRSRKHNLQIAEQDAALAGLQNTVLAALARRRDGSAIGPVSASTPSLPGTVSVGRPCHRSSARWSLRVIPYSRSAGRIGKARRERLHLHDTPSRHVGSA